MARLHDWFIAPPDASPRIIRSAGLFRALLGSLTAGASFVVASHDARWFHGRLFVHGGVRLAFVLFAIATCVAALEGGYRLIFGVARGAEPTARTSRGLHALYVLVAMLMVFVVAIASLGASAPDPTDMALDVRLPGPNERSVHYTIGNDASITIERVGPHR